MMPSVDTQIWMALRTRIEAAAEGLPVAFPGVKFDPPKSATGVLPFLSVGRTAGANRAGIRSRGKQDRTGVITLVYADAIGYEQEYYIERAALLLEHFPVDGALPFGNVCVRIGNGLAVPRVEAGYRDRGYWRTPSIIPWRCAA
jgi:hypothetical protein